MSTALPTLDRSTGYPMTPRSVPLARMHTRRRLTFWQWPGDIEDAVLVVSELTANAVTHARVPGRQVWVRLAATEDGGLLVDVSDPSPVLPVTDPRPEGEHGRGLMVVRQLALELDWFLRPDLGKTVRARLVPHGRRAELGVWSGGQRGKLRVGALGDQGEDAAGGGQVLGGYPAPGAGGDGGGLRADGGEQLAPRIRGAKVRAVSDEQLLGHQLVEGGADAGRIGLEGALDLGDEIVRRLRSVGGDGGAQGDLLLERGTVPGQDVLQDAAGGVVGQAEGAGVGDGCGGAGCGGGHGVVP